MTHRRRTAPARIACVIGILLGSAVLTGCDDKDSAKPASTSPGTSRADSAPGKKDLSGAQQPTETRVSPLSGDYSFGLPEGFKIVPHDEVGDETDSAIVPKDLPPKLGSTDMISILSVASEDLAPGATSMDDIKKHFAENFSGQKSARITGYTSVEVAGQDALWMDMSFSHADMAPHRSEIVLPVDRLPGTVLTVLCDSDKQDSLISRGCLTVLAGLKV
jgi:hypothetical protein